MGKKSIIAIIIIAIMFFSATISMATSNNENANITTNINVDNVGETTITRVEEKEKIVLKTFWDWWKPTKLEINKTKVNLKDTPQIVVEKSAETMTGVEELTYTGQNITYVIKVTNEGNSVAENIEITDKIPQGTEFVSIEKAQIEGGANFTGTDVQQGDEVIGVKWIVTIPAGKTVEAKFTVKVTATEGTIYNTAVANGEESNKGEPTKTSIITSTKTSKITRNSKIVEIAKENDLITYTITVKNTGKIAGTTTIEDTVPAGTEFVITPEREGAIVAQDKKSISWNITVPAGEEVSKQFTVKVADINGVITNIATIGNTDTEPDITETAKIEVKKEVVDIKRNGQSIGKTAEVKENDVIEYKITVTNNGSKDLTDVIVEEKLANIDLNQSELTIGELLAGESKVINATYTVKYDTDIYKNEAKLVNNEVEVTGKTKVDPNNPNEEPQDVKDEDKTETKIEEISLIEINKKATAVLVKNANGFERKEITTNMSVQPTVRPGDMIEYVITVQNKGNTVLENIKVTDILTVKVGSENGTEKTAGSIIYEKDKLEPSEEPIEIKVYYTVTEQDADVTVQTFINNEAKVTATESDNPQTPVEDTDNDDTVEVERCYTVIYAPGTQGTFNANDYTYENILYGNETPIFPGTPTGNAGYYFKKWDKEIAPTVTENVTYTAIWEGLQVTKNRTEIVDISGSGNISYVDQEGDIIKYTITVTNIGDEIAEGIQVLDNLPVTVTSIEIADIPVTVQNAVFDRDKNLLEGIQNVSLQKGESIEITVEYTVTAQELVHALKEENKKLLNTAIAVLNGKTYTGTDGEGTDVNGKPTINISKSGSTHVNAGGKIQYLITVDNTGYIGTTVTVTDELFRTIDTETGGVLEITYVTNSTQINDTSTDLMIIDNSSEPSITDNISGNKVLTWEFYIEALSTKKITFEAKVPNNAFGLDIKNTANLKYTVETEEENKISNEVITKVNEIHVVHDEYLEGQLGTDLNIIFVLDNSSSMNYPIEGQTYEKNSSPISPSDVYKTRLYSAKQAIESFIDEHGENQNTTMSVITFNKSSTGTESNVRTLMNIDEESIITIKNNKYIEIDGIEYRITNNKIQGSDGNYYYGVYIPIEYGPKFVGTNVNSTNVELKAKVDNISISSEKSGFGTYIYPAFEEINNNTSKYLSTTKKNIVIVLADGAFSGNYYSELQKSESNVDEIYCIGFGSGSEYNATALANMSTNGVCYEASDATTLLDAFEQIEESASKAGYGSTVNGTIDIDEATKEIIISETTPIVVTYATGHIDAEGHHIIATLFECKSTSEFEKYGITLSADKKVITWNAKVFSANHPEVIVPSEVYLKYYIQRSN